jgi:hypothetical protein
VDRINKNSPKTPTPSASVQNGPEVKKPIPSGSTETPDGKKSQGQALSVTPDSTKTLTEAITNLSLNKDIPPDVKKEILNTLSDALAIQSGVPVEDIVTERKIAVCTESVGEIHGKTTDQAISPGVPQGEINLKTFQTCLDYRGGQAR